MSSIRGHGPMTDGLPTCNASPERSYGRCQLASYLGEERAGVRWTPPYYVTKSYPNSVLLYLYPLGTSLDELTSQSATDSIKGSTALIFNVMGVVVLLVAVAIAAHYSKVHLYHTRLVPMF